MSPGPAFGRITSQNNLLNGIASGIGPGLHQCSHRKTKGTVLSNGLYKSTTALSVLASAEGSAGRHCNTDATLMKSSFPSTDGASQVGCSPRTGVQALESLEGRCSLATPGYAVKDNWLALRTRGSCKQLL